MTLNSEAHFPTFTARPTFVAPTPKSFYGVNQNADTLVGSIRGFGTDVITERREALTTLFDGDDTERGVALASALALGRPLVIFLEPPHRALLEWMQRQPTARMVFESGAGSVWVVERSVDFSYFQRMPAGSSNRALIPQPPKSSETAKTVRFHPS
jgi:hypothetical protein